MFRALLRNKKFIGGFTIIFLMVVISIFSDFIAPFGYREYNVGPKLEKPNTGHFFGTDHVGRDTFSRVLYGTRVTLLVAISVATGCLVIGIVLGVLAGYYNNSAIDNLIMRVTDIFFSIPWILTGLVLALIMRPGIVSVSIALILFYAPQMTRVVRGTSLGIKELDFVTAARICGENDFSIILRYIIPNCFGPIIVQTMLIMSYSILGEAALSFLGYGVRPPIPSWGILLQDAANYIWAAPYLVIFPGIAIVIGVLGFNYLGDGLRDIIDPKYRRTFLR
jgi:peptide/nickel transport system permease protein